MVKTLFVVVCFCFVVFIVLFVGFVICFVKDSHKSLPMEVEIANKQTAETMEAYINMAIKNTTVQSIDDGITDTMRKNEDQMQCPKRRYFIRFCTIFY